MTASPIATPFGATSTAQEVLSGVDLSGRRAIVTGGASGIGLETARALATAGAQVTLAVRSLAAGETAAADIKSTSGNGSVAVLPLDLADQGSVDAFVGEWDGGPLHILVNNAGVMAPPETRTAEGWELQFATNHLGHFALTMGLHGALASAGARVVVVSSVGHVNADVDFDDLNFERRPYDAFEAYGQSKTANVLFAVEAARRWADDGIAVNALNPGRITGTNLSRHLADVLAAPARFDPASTDVSYKNAGQGAATSALLAASPLVEGVTGCYFEDCNEAVPYVRGVRRGVAPWALDPEHAARLWQVSLGLIAAGKAKTVDTGRN